MRKKRVYTMEKEVCFKWQFPRGKFKQRKHTRRANWRLSLPGIVECPQCKSMKAVPPRVQEVRLLRRQAGCEGRR